MGISYQNKPLPEPFAVYIQNFDFERYLEYATEDLDCELLNGVLVIHSPASLDHELIFKFLLNLLDLYIQKKNLGLVIGSRFTMRLSQKWAPEPDIMFIEKSLQDHLNNSFLEGPATVVFEILSQSTREDDLIKKLPKYLESGVKEVWIIDPENHHISIHWENQQQLIDKSEWAVSKFIPKFRIKTDWLWEVNKIMILDALKEILKS